jgi:lipooligosaccharide transport system permease protein
MIGSGALEPIIYLLALRVGIGRLVGTLNGPNGKPIDYVVFVAPALLATSAMNGVLYDATWNFFYKMRESKTFDTMLSTPLGPVDVASGELGWALIRAGIQALFFVLVMAALGLFKSWWGVLALPGAFVTSFAFAGLGLAATTHARSWPDFDKIQLAVVPMFLFSATFYPLTQYSPSIRWIVRATPLYNGVALLRALSLGAVDASSAGHAAYLLLMGACGLVYASRRLARLLLH